MPALLQPNQVGIREELADYIAYVDAKSTPFISMAPKGKGELGNMTFSWLVDNYASPQLGGVSDGTDVSTYNNPVASRTRLYNYAQVFRRDLRVGFVAETQNVAGVATSEVANGIAKRLVEIKRDLEATFLLTNQAAQLEVNSTTPYQTGSLGNWLLGTNSSNIGAVASGSAFAPAGGVTPGTASTNAISSVTTANFTETTAQNVLTAIYGNTGVFRDYDVFCGAALKRAFTNLTSPSTALTLNSNAISSTAVRTFNQELSDSSFISNIDLFEGDFGRLILHPDLFVGHNNAGNWETRSFRGYVVPMDMVEVRYAKMPEVKELPDAGGGPIRLIQAIAGLVVKNPAGFGMFAGAS